MLISQLCVYISVFFFIPIVRSKTRNYLYLVIFFPVAETRLIKWWRNIFFWVNCPFKPSPSNSKHTHTYTDSPSYFTHGCARARERERERESESESERAFVLSKVAARTSGGKRMPISWLIANELARFEQTVIVVMSGSGVLPRGECFPYQCCCRCWKWRCDVQQGRRSWSRCQGVEGETGDNKLILLVVPALLVRIFYLFF